MASPSFQFDPCKLSDLYFNENDRSETSQEATSYVNPNISVTSETVLHGRGMITSKDISAGECLFIISPVVHTPALQVRERWENQNSMSIEDVAMKLLLEKMMAIVKNNEHSVLNSLLALVGTNKIEQECNTSISRLLGKDDTVLHSGEKLVSLTEGDLKNIVLKNAFGPDFFTYESIERIWTSPSKIRPMHLIGMYPLAAMLNHSCSANAVRCYAGEIMIVHACQDISKGSEIVWGYIPAVQPMVERRRVLRKKHGFVCKCERCLVESKYLRNDILPTTSKQNLSIASRWNRCIVDVRNNDLSEVNICNAYAALEELLNSSFVTNEAKRYVRVAFTNLHFNYFNVVLTSLHGADLAHQDSMHKLILSSATQLHLAFAATSSSSTEHLCVLHLCYELMSDIHRKNSVDKEISLPKVKFWTEALKKAHLVRYGELSDLESTRKLMVHTRTVLRQLDGFLKSPHLFL